VCSVDNNRAHTSPAQHSNSIALENTLIGVSACIGMRSIRPLRIPKGSTDMVSEFLDNLEHRKKGVLGNPQAPHTNVCHGVHHSVKTALSIVGTNDHGFSLEPRVVTDQN
jgi:hypothetical protein